MSRNTAVICGITSVPFLRSGYAQIFGYQWR